MDSGLLFVLLGYEQEGTKLISANLAISRQPFKSNEQHYAAREGEKAKELESLFAQYKAAMGNVTETNLPVDERRQEYFANLLPLFGQIKSMPTTSFK